MIRKKKRIPCFQQNPWESRVTLASRKTLPTDPAGFGAPNVVKRVPFVVSGRSHVRSVLAPKYLTLTTIIKQSLTIFEYEKEHVFVKTK